MFGSGAAGNVEFQQLRTVLLRDNFLKSWSDVDSLNRLKHLTDLRLTGNPVLNDARGGGRYEVFVRLMLKPMQRITIHTKGTPSMQRPRPPLACMNEESAMHSLLKHHRWCCLLVACHLAAMAA